MATIVFKLKDDMPRGEIGTALKQICSMTELFNVKAVFPNDEAQGRNLVYTADVTTGASPSSVLRAVKAAPYVQYAQVPPVRGCDVH